MNFWTMTYNFTLLLLDKSLMEYSKLNSNEEDVILDKRTEPAFSGEYDNFFEKGTYVCRRCGIPLYHSDTKFNAGCGWPSFDSVIKDVVLEKTDPDGERIEISCANCGAHLGHIFRGEKLTPKDTRHCVNSASLRFIHEKEKLPKVVGFGSPK